MKFRVGACALLVCLAGCSGKGPNTDFAELRGAAATKSAAGQLPKLQLGRVAAKSIASAPDRGALVSYQNKGVPTKREGAYTFYPVAISEDHALKALVTGEMSMPMPDGSQVKLKYERHDESPDGNWTWIGRVVGGDPQQEAIVTFGEKAVFASIPQPNGAPPLSIQTRNGALFAVQTDPSKVKSPNKGHNDMLVPSALALREAAAAQVQTNAQVSQNAIAQNAPPTSANTVDVAIGYTTGYRAFYGSQSATVTRLTFLITVGNQAYSNSSINGYLRLVNATEVAYTDGNSNQTALHELTGSNGTSAVTVPASLTPLRTARDQYGADIAILVRDFQQPEHQGCGIAWLIGANQKEIVPSDASWAYAVVSDGDDQGSDGQSYYCAPETLVHEASHLMGSAHDVANAANASGRYPYSYGYKTANGNFFTIMAYGDEGQASYRVFSNPNLTTCGGNACGVANQADNARSLNQTIPLVAQFRATAVPFLGGKRNDINGDGRSDILWRNASSQQFSHWAMNGSSIISSAAKGMISSYYIAGTGDFNGDGLADVLWKNDAARFLIIWQADVNGGYTQLEIGGFAPNLSLAGIGDFNEDGRSDILWHNKPANQLFYWAMNGRAPTQSASFSMPAWFDIIGVGDFNGDGAADIAYSSGADVNLYFNNGVGSAFSGQRLTYSPAANGWVLLGIADSDGNGISDFFWRNSANGMLTIWKLSSAGSVSSTASYSPSTLFTFAALGDYNSDGRADILWDRREWRQLSVWLSQASGNFAGEVVGSYPIGWQAQQ